jgi:lipopolysaccharide assembly outer membrane protein LptD (OstA)
LNSTELFQSGIYFENNSTMSFLNRQFDERIWLGKEDPSYDVFRVDSDFVLTRPMKLMGFLSVVPRVGYRGTYYDKTKIVEEKIVTTTAEDGTVDSKTEKVAVEGDADFRNMFEFGAELSFKAFSTWQDNQGFIWRHVVEPYTDITLIPEPNLLPEQIYQFDEVDEIEESNTVRFGVRNRWQYKANNPQASVRELLYIDLYADFNLDATGEEDEFESLNLDLRFQPISWMKLYVEGEYEQEKSEVSEALFRLSVWHDAFKANVFYRYLVDESSLVSGVLTWNINPEWAASIYGRYEYETSRVEEVGTWIQRKFDCLAYRVYLTYEPSYTHLDGREEEEDLKVSFVLWLTGFEPDNLRELDDR